MNNEERVDDGYSDKLRDLSNDEIFECIPEIIKGGINDLLSDEKDKKEYYDGIINLIRIIYDKYVKLYMACIVSLGDEININDAFTFIHVTKMLINTMNCTESKIKLIKQLEIAIDHGTDQIIMDIANTIFMDVFTKKIKISFKIRSIIDVYLPNELNGIIMKYYINFH